MDIQTQIEEIAVSSFATAMKSCPPDSKSDDSGLFKLLMTIKVDGELKQLLIFGKTHRFYGDGRCFAVLNPSVEVLECAKAKLYYEKCAFTDQCDMVSCQWINTNGRKPVVTGGYTYKARKPQPARTVMI